MSAVTTGTVFMSRHPTGDKPVKYLRMFKVKKDDGWHEYLQETNDLACATVLHGNSKDARLRERAKRMYPDAIELPVAVTRTVVITSGVH